MGGLNGGCRPGVNRHVFLLTGLLVWTALSGPAFSRQPANQAPNNEKLKKKGRARQFLKFATQAAQEYEFTSTDRPGNRMEFQSQPILRWTNPIGEEWDGVLFVWTANGRPEVVLSLYKSYSRPGQPVTHEFHSLSLGPISAERGQREVWRPRNAGVELDLSRDAPLPSKSARSRLLQMRNLARGFELNKTERDGTQRKLRLLSQPLFRYQSKNDEILDGALFGFVQATDPEVILLIEARQENGAYRWHYGLVRMNSVAFQAQYKNREVWKVPELPWEATRNRTEAYRTCRWSNAE